MSLGIPLNIIICWSGPINEIPNGWFLCDGSTVTSVKGRQFILPDLRNKFIVGSGNLYSLEDTGGSADSINVTHGHTGETNETGLHNHTFPESTGTSQQAPAFKSGVNAGANAGQSQNGPGAGGAHSHALTVSTVGESGVGKNLPPYLALAYIMFGGE